MINRDTVERYLKLRANGYSAREAAKAIHVARGTAARIDKRLCTGQGSHRQTEWIWIKLGRCPQCGRRIMLPCLACELERINHVATGRRRG